ncbi:helix-turn-helix domain-containing protein [Desulfovibrio inopinatus]|uniref:helix-turn-helix domain-containing protein n=1 Tax=Desulfovibrio inopinatus TaxID=102109 RepID=UPI0003F7B6BB|nr:AraC family transcriptional regulator [Desulfovibrio inopinatus]
MQNTSLITSTACSQSTAQAVAEVASILRDNIEAPPRLVELARRVGFSAPRLNREFRRIFGTTVFGYLRILRLEEARNLLENSDINITEAAFSVGYQSLPSFSQAFRGYFGMSPRQYRNDIRRIS